MHALVDTAETCIKFFSMKRQFYQYIVSLLNIAAYSSMEVFSVPKMLQSQTNARTL